MPPNKIPGTVGTRPCYKCQEPAEPTSWKSEKGLEPFLRQFKCPKCGHVFYLVIKSAQQLMAVSHRVTRLQELKGWDTRIARSRARRGGAKG